MADDHETKLSDLINKYPNRWEQAIANPNLRGWFVNQMTGGESSAVERALALKAIDRRAVGQSQPVKGSQSEGS